MLSEAVTTELARAREAGEFCDMEFVCGNENISAHKIIACSQCPVFHAAITGDFKERSGRYEIKDFPYATVRRMVEYLYRGDYIGWTEGTDDADRDKAAALLLHLKMFSIADKYGITGLLSISSKRFITTLGMKVDAAVLEKVVPRIYELNIPARSAIRQSFITLCRKWLSAEWRDALAANLLDQLTEDAPEFTKDLLLSTLRAPRFGHCHCCSPNSLAPLEPLQFKCKTCGKGGASPCSIGRECTYCFRIEDMQE